MICRSRARQRLDLACAHGLVEVVDVLEAERREVVVALVHLLDDPGERLGRLLGVRDDRRDEVRDAFVCRQLDALRVHEDEAHLLRRGAHEDRGDHRVDEARLSGARGSGDEQVRHLREVGDDVGALDVLAHTHDHGVLVAARRVAAQHVPERDVLAVEVRDLDADGGLARDGAEDAHVGRGDGIRDVLRQGGDALDLGARAELDLVARDRRAAREARDGGVDVELVEDVGQRLDDAVVGLAAGLVRRAGRQHRRVGQAVGDVAAEAQLLDPRRQLRHGRRDELGLRADLARVGGAEGLRVRRVDDLLAALSPLFSPPGRGASRPGGVARFSPGRGRAAPSSSSAFWAAWRKASSPSRSDRSTGLRRARLTAAAGASSASSGWSSSWPRSMTRARS